MSFCIGMIWSHTESSHLLLASLRVQGAHYNSREASKDTSSCPGHRALLLIHALSKCLSCRSHQKDGEDTSFCRSLEGMLVRHLHHVRSTSNSLCWAFDHNSLLLCRILPYCKMALKFCPSESSGQQRGPGKSHGDQPRAQEDCRLCGDMSQAGLAETRTRHWVKLWTWSCATLAMERKREEETKVFIF